MHLTLGWVAALRLTERPLVGKSGLMTSLFAYAEKVARTDSTLLITGETGTGKDHLARYVHSRSRRAQQAMMCINCAAIPDTLIESELFGYERGAFTGAQQSYPGKFKLADKGTLLLDEIGDLSFPAQAKLLRVIEEQEVFRIGARRSESVDVRIIASTNRDLESMVAEKRFRPDLFFRLNVARIHVPPLRQRREDIPLLFAHFLEEIGQHIGIAIDGTSSEALDCLLRHPWPGNIRELRNVAESLFIDPPHGLVQLQHLPPVVQRCLDGLERAEASERERILTALFATHWNKCRAAKELHWSRMTLYRKLTKYQITKPLD
ncbi:sigma-54 dependent transcriptional regulator [Lysobacter sp. CFH 32150]|uniref:sigma-54 interaction domain-containing protein n=1 Tax=Lysobacter sp. CFH 32150 TaxID=2927128 RepID=UPI0031F31489